MTTTVVVRQLTCRVFHKGAELPYVRQVRWSHGWDLGTATASVVVAALDPTGSYESEAPLSILAGAGSNNVQRFTGVVIDRRFSLYPRGVELICKGKLYFAEQFKPTTEDGIYLDELVGGDFGATDQVMVRKVLDMVPELAGYDASLIGGTGVTLGSTNPEAFTWEQPKTAMEFIQDLDAVCLGYRLVDLPGGGLGRIQISGHPNAAASVTLTEGEHIVEGSVVRGISSLVNAARVSGFDDGTGLGLITTTDLIQESNPFQPATEQHVFEYSSPLIERGDASEPGDGLSAEDVANYWLGERNRELVTVEITTPLDSVIRIGDTFLLQGPGGAADRLGTGENIWTIRNDGEIGEGGFKQHLSGIGGGLGGDPADGPSPPLAPGAPAPLTGGGGGYGEPLLTDLDELIYTDQGDLVFA